MLLQWHPAFYADIQIEFTNDKDNLLFENEHQLSTKPMEIDVVIIKKSTDIPLRTNIGRIFRKYNIIEYKSPKDYLSIDDFYKVYGYACFYKVDSGSINSIAIEDMTITLVCHTCPRKLMEYLQTVENYRIETADEGIYYIKGDRFPIQIIVIRELSPDKNLWLSSLTDHLEDRDLTRRLLADYQVNQKNPLYRSVMNTIVRSNRSYFEEVKNMCEALEELMKDELDAREQQGEIRVNRLILKLSQCGRISDIIRSASDSEYQKQLFSEFGL